MRKLLRKNQENRHRQISCNVSLRNDPLQAMKRGQLSDSDDLKTNKTDRLLNPLYLFSCYSRTGCSSCALSGFGGCSFTESIPTKIKAN